MNIMRMILSPCAFATLSVLALLLIPRVLADSPQCGEQAGGALCRPGYCCSTWGFCGTTGDYCDEFKCQSQCPSPSPPPPPPPSTPPPPSPPPPTPPPPSSPPPTPPPPSLPDITETVSREIYRSMFSFLDEYDAPSKEFYTFDAFVDAARNFTGFGTTGNITERRREVSAFLGQTGFESAALETHEYVIPHYLIREDFDSDAIPSYCVPNAEWPCAPGKNYYGRGPLQIRYNYNYGACGAAIGEDLLGNPDLVETDAVISFKCALWFWMTAQPPTIPSSHDVILGIWEPTPSDIADGRFPASYGIITNIFNGKEECGLGFEDYGPFIRAFFYRYTFGSFLSIGDEQNLTCDNQKPFPPPQQLLPSVQDISPALLLQ